MELELLSKDQLIEAIKTKDQLIKSLKETIARKDAAIQRLNESNSRMIRQSYDALPEIDPYDR